MIWTILIGLFLSTESQAETKQQIVERIVRTATKHGVNPRLALAVATVESNLNPHAIGSLGELGVFQLRPEYHDTDGDNIDTAIRYLAYLKEKCSDYPNDSWVVCFNYGHSRKLKHPTKFPYYRKVIEQVSKL